MAIKIKLEDLNIKNNIIHLNPKIFYIEKINTIIIRGFENINSDKYTQIIHSNDLFQIYNIISTIEFYRTLKVYFTIQEVLYSNIHNTDIINSFAYNIYTDNESSVFINMPFYMNNCYYIQSIPEQVEILKNGIYVYNFLTIRSILYLYNPLLFRIVNLIKILTSSFFLYEYIGTEHIEFAYINNKNLYFNNIIDFINYCNVMNIHIENINIYKKCYNKSAIEIFNILIEYFQLNNLNFNLPHDIDVLHYNFWSENIYINEKLNNSININCIKYQIISNQIQYQQSTYSTNQLPKPSRHTYISYMEILLNDINTLNKIYNSNVLLFWQHNNLKLIWNKLEFKNDKIYYNNKLCYLTLYNCEKINMHVYNLDTGLFI